MKCWMLMKWRKCFAAGSLRGNSGPPAFYHALARRERKEYGVLLDCSRGMGLADSNVARSPRGRTGAAVGQHDWIQLDVKGLARAHRHSQR